MRRSWSATLTLAGIFMVVMGFGIAAAQGVPSKPNPQPATTGEQQAAAASASERDFVSQLAMSNMAAIQLGHLAAKKAQHADVQKFAKSTIDGRLKAQQKLADAAYGAGVQWPNKLDEKNRQVQERLSRLSNEEFDREYMKTTINQHRDLERMLAARANGGTSADARPGGDAKSDSAPLAAKVNQWAAMTLSEIRAHLKEAEQVSGQIEKAE
jgi:predicted outer membrane protein